jgi:hypothetical protein
MRLACDRSGLERFEHFRKPTLTARGGEPHGASAGPRTLFRRPSGTAPQPTESTRPKYLNTMLQCPGYRPRA